MASRLVAGSAIAIAACVGAPAASGDIHGTGPNVVQVSPPASVVKGAYEHDVEVRVFAEQESHELGSAIQVDISAPGVYDEEGDLTPTVVTVGTIINSYYMHFDPLGAHDEYHPGTGWISFTTDQAILGLIVTYPNLNASDPLLGYPSTVYPNDGTAIELVTPTNDVVTLLPDMRSVEISWLANHNVDAIRIITPEPGVLVLLALGAPAVVRRRR